MKARSIFFFLFCHLFIYCTDANEGTVYKSHTFLGLKDFELLPAEDGRTAYYREPGRNVLSIDAANKSTHGKYAGAQTTFKGPSILYDVKITTMVEYDGESEYHLLVNSKIVAKFSNPRVDKKGDLKMHQHIWKDIRLKTGDIVGVQSAVHSNGLIPEGEAFAFARGRWSSLEFIAK